MRNLNSRYTGPGPIRFLGDVADLAEDIGGVAGCDAPSSLTSACELSIPAHTRRRCDAHDSIAQNRWSTPRRAATPDATLRRVCSRGGELRHDARHIGFLGGPAEQPLDDIDAAAQRAETHQVVVVGHP